ncbi:helix-turn-helix domain-containing protein [Actinomadura litoris]|nr:helix-turn-helix domain-containing protein [Actinomadura litoris]
MTHRSDDRPARAQGRVTGAERARVAELHALGWSRGAIARDLGRSPDTIRRIADAAELSFDRSRTAVAVAAKQVDNRARRASLIARAYDQAGAVLDRLEAPDGYDATGTATNGVTVTTRVAVPPAHDVKALAGAFSTLTASAARMEAVDSGTDVEDAKSMLSQLGDALGVVAHAIDGGESGG